MARIEDARRKGSWQRRGKFFRCGDALRAHEDGLPTPRAPLDLGHDGGDLLVMRREGAERMVVSRVLHVPFDAA